MPTVRNLARISWQIIVVGAVTLVLGEMSVRICRYLVPSAFPSVAFYDQSYNRYRGRPGASDYGFRLNSAGFKDVEFTESKQVGILRVVAVGDSFAFGVVPYEYNYLTLTEQHLNDGGLRAEVINMGIPGLAPQDYLALLANEGLKLQPDLVLISFFVGNDFDETRRLRTQLYEFSDLLALIKFVVDTRTKFDGRVFHGEDRYDDSASSFREPIYLEIVKQRSWVYRKPPPHPRALNAAVDYLVQIRDLCTRSGVPLLVLVIPDELQVNQALQGRILESLDIGQSEIDFTQPNRFLAEHFRRHGIEAIDVLNSFAARGKEVSLYKPLDSHWNIAGNELAAKLLAPPLAARLASGPRRDSRSSQD